MNGAITDELRATLTSLPLGERIAALNELKRLLHELSPHAGEPVDCVVWVPADAVAANDYNPNAVAPPEMELLHTSILQDGYTQPIVVWESEPGRYTVVDGFHRNRVGKERADVRERVHGHLPVTVINTSRTDLGDRMVSTIRHNRARGKHNVDSMSDIVVELKRRNWTDDKISKALGMQADEILRLCQVSGLTEMFKDARFSRAWDLGDLEAAAAEGGGGDVELETLLRDPDDDSEESDTDGA